MSMADYTSLRVLLQGSGTEGQLASVPEESTTGFTDPLPPPNSYRDSIRSVRIVFPEWRIRSSLSDQSRSTYSSDSGASRSNNSGHSSGSASAFALERLGNQELWRIARQMSSDGYTQRMVQAFDGASPTPALNVSSITEEGHLALVLPYTMSDENE